MLLFLFLFFHEVLHVLSLLLLFRRLTPCLTGQVSNLHTTLVQRASDTSNFNQESKLTSPSSSKIDSQSGSSNSLKTDSKDDQLTENDSWKQNEPGLMEFFEPQENWGAKVVRVGKLKY